MGLPKPEAEPKPAISRGFLFGIVFVLVGLLLMCGFFIAGQYSARCFSPTFGNQPHVMGADKYIEEITDFYKTVISIQFAVIGVVLAVAFVYVHTVSRQQARDIATDALDSPSFQRDLDHRFKDLETRLAEAVKAEWINVKNESDLEEIRASQQSILARVAFVEQVMDAYTGSDKKTGLTLQEPHSEDEG